jgi:hypothetical protein
MERENSHPQEAQSSTAFSRVRMGSFLVAKRKFTGTQTKQRVYRIFDGKAFVHLMTLGIYQGKGES